MTGRVTNLIHRSNTSTLRLAVLSTVAAAATLLASGSTALGDAPQQLQEHDHSSHGEVPAKLVETVRYATRHFVDVNAAGYAGYLPMFGCVSGPDHGAMGIHYINGALVGDGEINASQPEALIYEPTAGGLRLVGVEYIVDAATWLAHHDAPPMLEGQAFQMVSSPNRYGLPTFFELHVWAWRDNPQGAFVDWNTQVSCEGR